MILKADKNQVEYKILSTKLYFIYLFIYYINIRNVSHSRMYGVVQPAAKCKRTFRAPVSQQVDVIG